MNWIDMDQNMDKWHALVNNANELQHCTNCGKFFD